MTNTTLKKADIAAITVILSALLMLVIQLAFSGFRLAEISLQILTIDTLRLVVMIFLGALTYKILTKK